MGSESLTSEHGLPIIPRMSKKDRTAGQAPADDIAVHLKPILGMRPGTYLTGLYAVAVVVLLFFILLYPGLHRHGAFLAITTYPGKATVKVDGAYAGSTPCIIFLKSGSRTVEISKPYYSPVTLNETVSGRVFATLLFPDTSSTKQQLRVSDLDGLLAWSLGDFQKNPEIPQIFSDASRAAVDEGSRSKVYDFLDNSARYVTAEFQLRELLLAAARASSRNSFLSPSALVDLVEDSVHVKQKYDNAPSWLLLTLARDKAVKLASGDWIQQYLSMYRGEMSKYYQGSFPPSAGAAEGSWPCRVQVIVPSPRVSSPWERMTTSTPWESQWTRSCPTLSPLIPFTLARRKSPTGSLLLSSRRRLSLFRLMPPAGLERPRGRHVPLRLGEWKTSGGGGSPPVTSVSFHAAAAFCPVAHGRCSALPPGYIARLPLESGWNGRRVEGSVARCIPWGKPGAAVFFHKGAVGPSRAGPRSPTGTDFATWPENVWQWCADPYAPGNYLLSSSLDPGLNASYERSYTAGPDRVVRGGSWNNQSEQISVFARGSSRLTGQHRILVSGWLWRENSCQGLAWQRLTKASRSSRSTGRQVQLCNPGVFECGISLVGTEVKSIKEGRFSFADSYALVEKGELWLLPST